MANETWDVAVIGGGPAGSACAIALRQTFPALSVLLVESTGYLQARPGEVLPPLARGLLTHLDVLEQMNEAQARPSSGLASAWGSGTLEEKDYFFGTSGEGWHLDRSLFDAMLAHKARALGATLWLHTSLHEAERRTDVWHLRLSADRTATARWVVDATGRKAAFARRQAVTQHVQDRLTAYLSIVRCREARTAQSVIEAVPQGWWYTAPLPAGRRVVGLLTDADIGRSLAMSSEQPWRRALDATTHMRRILGHDAAFEQRMVRSAATLSLSTPHGEGWIAVGDAAAAYDPLSGCGIVHALRSGIVAAFATGDRLSHGQSTGLARYQAMLRSQIAQFETSRRRQYGLETRWSESPFWQRRQQDAHTRAHTSLAAEVSR